MPTTTASRAVTALSAPSRRLLRSTTRSHHRRTWLVLLAALVAWFFAHHHQARNSTVQPRRQRAHKQDEAAPPDDELDIRTSFPPLDKLLDTDRLWPSNLDKPLCDLKIYVYNLPPELRLPDKTVKQCRWSAYNSELLLHQLLVDPAVNPSTTSHPHDTLYTTDPADADFFLVPLFPACFLFDCWVKAGWTKTERCGVDDTYIEPVMRHVRESHPHWNASGGADHLVVHPMDFVDGYYTEASRAAMNASTYLVTVGDVRPAPYGSYFRSYRDLVIPSSTHLLNSYRVNPLDYVDEAGRPLVEPRGAASPHRRVDVDPPTVEMFSPSPEPVEAGLRGLVRAVARLLRRLFGLSHVARVEARTTLAIFRGGLGTATDGERYSLGIRSLFFPSDGNASTPPFSPHIHPGFSSLPGFDIAEWSDNDDYARRLARSRFGLAPPGYTLDTTRIYEYLAFGVVPVFIGSGPTAGQVMPFARDVDWSSFSLSVPRERAHELPEILERVTDVEYERMRSKVWDVGRKVVLEGHEGNVWRLLARDLCRLKRKGVAAGSEIANN
ncbi:hypothetical protein JCM8208_003072 [Rhodotorula glutinis]